MLTVKDFHWWLSHDKKTTHSGECNWQCASLFQSEYMDVKQASGLVA